VENTTKTSRWCVAREALAELQKGTYKPDTVIHHKREEKGKGLADIPGRENDIQICQGKKKKNKTDFDLVNRRKKRGGGSIKDARFDVQYRSCKSESRTAIVNDFRGGKNMTCCNCLLGRGEGGAELWGRRWEGLNRNKKNRGTGEVRGAVSEKSLDRRIRYRKGRIGEGLRNELQV